MNYNEAYSKIIEAYFKDEIKPINPEFCFCGTLCENTQSWFKYPRREHLNSHGYNGNDFVRMETALLNILDASLYAAWWNEKDTPEYEAALFAGMSAALDVLKQIHIERGEVVDEVPVFVKRELV